MSDEHVMIHTRAIEVPTPAELRSLAEAIEKATNCAVLIVHGPLKMDERAQEAAILAASIVFHDANPDGAWVAENASFREHLAELCGLKGPWSPFHPERCPLSQAQVEAGLAYLRTIIGFNNHLPGREEAITFLAWAKRTSLDA